MRTVSQGTHGGGSGVRLVRVLAPRLHKLELRHVSEHANCRLPVPAEPRPCEICRWPASPKLQSPRNSAPTVKWYTPRLHWKLRSARACLYCHMPPLSYCPGHRAKARTPAQASHPTRGSAHQPCDPGIQSCIPAAEGLAECLKLVCCTSR
jgi:hypothetical protein